MPVGCDNVLRFMVRLDAVQCDAGLKPGANGFHSTKAYLTVALPWTEAVLDGERDWGLDPNPLDRVGTTCPSSACAACPCRTVGA